MADDLERSRLIQRLRRQLNDALRYAQAGAEKLAECEQQLMEAKRTAQANKALYEKRLVELVARIDELERERRGD